MSEPAPKRTFVKDDHRVSTGVPAEAVRLRARGYREEKPDAPVGADESVSVDPPAESAAGVEPVGQPSATTVADPVTPARPKPSRNKSE